MNEISALIRNKRELLYPSYQGRTQQKRTIYEPESGLHQILNLPVL